MIFFELAMTALVLLFVYFIWQQNKNTSFLIEKKDKYLSLYELYKLNEQLISKGLSFDALDDFGQRFYPKEKSIKTIDQNYKIENNGKK